MVPHPKQVLVSSKGKQTPVASKSWKEKWRTACLERARLRRGHYQRALESSETNVDNYDADSNNNNNMNNSIVGIGTDNDISTARWMIEDEMRHHGIALISPTTDEDSHSNNHRMICEEEMDGLRTRVLEPTANHFISEEELFDLLAEVEQEMERTDALRVEEILDLARCEELDLEDQIAEYERWEESKKDDEMDVDKTVCPTCHEANLLQQADQIVCPNTMDGSCNFQLPLDSSSNDVSLAELRRRLSDAYEHHSSSNCLNFLQFEMLDQHDRRCLCAVCSTCQMSIFIA